MDTLRSDFKHKYNHDDILIHSNSEYKSYAKWLMEYFENEIAQGVKFKPEETVAVGWSLVKFSGQKELTIFEPSFKSIPISWEIGANRTLSQLMLQNEVCSQTGAAALYPSILQSAVISPTFLDDHEDFVMLRDSPCGSDSGWVFRQKNYGGSDGTHCSLYEIACIVPKLIPFLAMPKNTNIEITKTNIEILKNNSSFSSENNDFLKNLCV